MLFYTLKRFGVAVLVLISVSLITFALLRFSGDPAAAMATVGRAIEAALADLETKSGDELRNLRRDKFIAMGRDLD